MDSTKKYLQQTLDELNLKKDETSKLLSQSDDDMKEMVEEELKGIEEQLTDTQNSLTQLDKKYETKVVDEESGVELEPNIAIMEIRAGTGGDEAQIFAADLLRMYTRYFEIQKWEITPLYTNDNLAGGLKTSTIEIKGKDVYEKLKYESGVHRVQRIPTTESSGRIHTSAASVAILPKVKKIELNIKPEDLKWDFYRAGGKGGQNVNKVSTAVRLTHIPSGTVVECQKERQQGKNREKALSILESRIYMTMKEQQVKSITDLRTSQVGTGERNEKIRTYNFPQDRITDHRIKKSFGNISNVLDGDIEKILKTVRTELKTNNN